MSESKGILPAGLRSVALMNRPLKIINVIAKGKALEETEMAFAIHEKTLTAEEPQGFYLTGTQTINFFPAPTSAIEYIIRTVDDIAELTWEDDSPLLTEFDDFLVEYATIVLNCSQCTKANS